MSTLFTIVEIVIKFFIKLHRILQLFNRSGMKAQIVGTKFLQPRRHDEIAIDQLIGHFAIVEMIEEIQMCYLVQQHSLDLKFFQSTQRDDYCVVFREETSLLAGRCHTFVVS